MSDNAITTQWCVHAKSKKKSKKNKKKNKKKSRRSVETQNFASPSKKSSKSSVATLASVPTIGKTATASVNQSGANNLLAVGTPKGMSNQVLNYKAIRVNYNPTYRIPNCVAYELTNTMVAMADAPDAEKRKNYNFSRDNNVPGCPDWGDYRGSGYTRGHMAPAMDMRWDKQVMKECFYMTNMCPQEAKLNNEGWRKLEESVHRWARRDGRIIVFTGPIMGSKPATIGKSTKGIAVPSAFYKVLYAPQQGRAIAFIYNNQPCSGSIDRYAVSIEEVQRRTGLQFLTTLPSATRNSLLKQCKINDWK
jgi:endonuclease G